MKELAVISDSRTDRLTELPEWRHREALGQTFGASKGCIFCREPWPCSSQRVLDATRTMVDDAHLSGRLDAERDLVASLRYNLPLLLDEPDRLHEHEPEIFGYCGETDIILGCSCGWRQGYGVSWPEHLAR